MPAGSWRGAVRGSHNYGDLERFSSVYSWRPVESRLDRATVRARPYAPYVHMPVSPVDLDAFASEIRRLAAEPEPSLYPAFANLVRRGMSRSVQVDQLRRAPLTGFPDLTVTEGARARTWIEVKHPANVDVDHLPDADQQRFDNYKDQLPHVVLTNGWKWLLFENGHGPTHQCDLPQGWLTGTTVLSSAAEAKVNDFFHVLDSLPPVSATTRDDAIKLLASGARLLNRAVEELCTYNLPPVLQDARAAFDRLLRVNPVGGNDLSDEQFADTLAQTVVFGYLLAHIEEPTNSDIDPYSALAALVGAHLPFVKAALHALVAPDPDLEASLIGPLRTAAEYVNAAAPVLHAGGNWDAVVYAYEDFFTYYRPAARQEFGVYYTDKRIVDFQISEVRDSLASHFDGRTLLDPQVHFFDPACGTGTYLLGIAEAVAAEALAQGTAVGTALEDLFLNRLTAFEVSPGPSCVAQARLAAFLRDHSVYLDDRLPVYTVNSLTPPPAAGGGAGTINLWAEYVGAEQQEGDRIKQDLPILVVIGNPPYGRRDRDFFDTGDPTIGNLLDDWATGAAGPARQSVYDLYVAFWRLACSLLLERSNVQTPEGIVSYITNRTWLDGEALGGMRDWISGYSPDARVFDLGGDRRRGARADVDGSVFNIEAGTAITTLSFSDDTNGSTNYFRLMGSRSEKLDGLAVGSLPAATQVVRTSRLGPFVPSEWGSLGDAPTVISYFARHHPGTKTARDGFLVDVDSHELSTRLAGWNVLSDDQRREAFLSARRRAAEARRGYATGRGRQIPASLNLQPNLICEYTYRPLDRRHIYADRTLIDDPGALFDEAMANRDLEYLAIPNRQFVNGPITIAGKGLVDYQIYGRGGADILPLSPPHGGTLQVDGTAATALSADAMTWASKLSATTDDVARYIIALANAPSYAAAYLSAIQTSEVRIPATTDPQIFREAVAIGDDLFDAWLLQRPEHGVWNQSAVTGTPLGEPQFETNGTATVLFANGDRLEDLDLGVVDMVINEHGVLLRYLQERAHLPLSMQLQRDIRLVAGAVQTLAAHRQASDNLLNRATAGLQETW